MHVVAAEVKVGAVTLIFLNISSFDSLDVKTILQVIWGVIWGKCFGFFYFVFLSHTQQSSGITPCSGLRNYYGQVCGTIWDDARS